MSIADQNSKNIRDPMQIRISLSARDTKASLSYSVTNATVKDSNLSTSLKKELWNMKKLADFSGEGFILNGTREFYDSSATTASEESGKLGIRTSTGSGCTVTVTADRTISAVTIAVTKGSGTISCNNETYDINRIVIIPVNGTSAKLVFNNSDQDNRIEIASIVPGMYFNFKNKDLISVTAALRGNTSLSDYTWKISELECKAYWPDDISEAVANINDNVALTYSAGYTDDMSRTRRFYISDTVTMEGNVITFKAQDASARLDRYKSQASCIKHQNMYSERNVYKHMISLIEEAGIKLQRKEAIPSASGSSKTQQCIYYPERSYREEVAQILAFGRNSHLGFWPVFVDAGYPHVKHTKPVATSSGINRDYGIWTIREEDCGDVQKNVERNIASIRSSTSTYGIKNKCSRDETTVFEEKDVASGKTYTYNFQNIVDDTTITVSNAEIISKNAQKVRYKAKKTTQKTKKKTKYKKKVNGKYRTYTKTETVKTNQCKIKARRLDIDKGISRMVESNNRPGYSLIIDPSRIALGMQTTDLNGINYMVFPNFHVLFDISNEIYTFKWKGDPRMQPRDLFYFVRLNGSKEVFTIEEIILEHEEGGTIATITARKGVC